MFPVVSIFHGLKFSFAQDYVVKFDVHAIKNKKTTTHCSFKSIIINKFLLP